MRQFRLIFALLRALVLFATAFAGAGVLEMRPMGGVHGVDYEAYCHSIRRNVQTRVDSFMKTGQKNATE